MKSLFYLCQSQARLSDINCTEWPREIVCCVMSKLLLKLWLGICMKKLKMNQIIHNELKKRSLPLLDQDYDTKLMYGLDRYGGVYFEFPKSKRMSHFEQKMRESEYRRYKTKIIRLFNK